MAPQANQAPKIKGVADIVFCIDATGSMEPCIEGVKTGVQNFVSGLQSDAQKPIDWRAKIFAFRDLKNGEPFEIHEFTDDKGEFANQVSTLSATGGDDLDESVLDAIFVAATKSEWRENCHRVVVVLTDADSHPEMEASTVEAGQATDVDEVFNQVVANKVQLYIVGPKSAVYDSLSVANDAVFEEVDTSGDGLKTVDFTELMENIGKTVSASAPVQQA